MNAVTLDDLKRQGLILPVSRMGEQRAICPLCSGSRKKKNAKDLAINFSKGTWFCHHCSTGGVIRSSVSYRRPVLKPPSSAQSSLEKFFEKRCISPATYKRQGIYQTENMIAFPYYDGKFLINVKYRGANKTFRLESDCELILYGINNIKENKPLIFTEGEIDCLSILEIGLKNVVSVPNGAQGKLDYLNKAGLKLKKCSHFILALDNDKAGIVLLNNLLKRLGEENCKIVTWPEGCKDANDVLMKYGKDKLKEAIKNAKTKIYGTVSPDERLESTLLFYKNGYRAGLKTGWQTLDSYYSIFPGNIDVITGVPGSGKSAFVESLVLNLFYQGFKTLLFSPEGGDIEEHLLSFACKIFKAAADRKHPKAIGENNLRIAIDSIKKHIFFIDPSSEMKLNLDVIISLTKKKIIADGINGLVIDPWNQLQHFRPSHLNETEYVGKALTNLKRLAISRNIHIWIVVHPKKMESSHSNQFGRTDKIYQTVQLYDLYGSSNWANKADCILSIKRLPDYFTEIKMIKVKSHKIGRLGTVTLKYNALYEGYSDKKEVFII